MPFCFDYLIMLSLRFARLDFLLSCVSMYFCFNYKQRARNIRVLVLMYDFEDFNFVARSFIVFLLCQNLMLSVEYLDSFCWNSPRLNLTGGFCALSDLQEEWDWPQEW